MEENYIKISREYLTLAEDDLFASKLLNENKRFNLSVFHLSQAVEKLTKSYCLMKSLDGINPIFNFKELKQFHSPLGLLMGLVGRYLDYPENPSSSFLKQVKKKFKKQKERINKITGKESYGKIVKEIDNLKQLDNLDVEKIIQDNYLIKNISKNQIENVRLYLESFKEFFPLSLLGIVTFKHYLSTRYPYEKVDKNGRIISEIKFTEYKEGFGIVDSLSELIKLTGQIIDKLSSNKSKQK